MRSDIGPSSSFRCVGGGSEGDATVLISVWRNQVHDDLLSAISEWRMSCSNTTLSGCQPSRESAQVGLAPNLKATWNGWKFTATLGPPCFARDRFSFTSPSSRKREPERDCFHLRFSKGVRNAMVEPAGCWGEDGNVTARTSDTTYRYPEIAPRRKMAAARACSLPVESSVSSPQTLAQMTRSCLNRSIRCNPYVSLGTRSARSQARPPVPREQKGSMTQNK